MKVFPNLIIGGTPKSGTSSLYDWLAAHPEVTGSVPKETFFLMDADNPMLNRKNNFHQHGLDAYHQFFQVNDTTKVVFEATTHYLYQQTALEVLSQWDPVPHIFFILRKPSARIYSSFEYTKNNRAAITKNLSFDAYVDLLLNGEYNLLDEYIDVEQSRYVLRKELSYSNYHAYLKQWAMHMPSEKLHIFLFETIVASPQSFMQRISKILDIDPGFYDAYDFTKRNETYTIRSKDLHKKAQYFSGWLPNGNSKKLLKKIYLRFQAAKKKTKTQHQGALQKLDRHFATYEKLLEREFYLDISPWK